MKYKVLLSYYEINITNMTLILVTVCKVKRTIKYTRTKLIYTVKHKRTEP